MSAFIDVLVAIGVDFAYTVGVAITVTLIPAWLDA